MNNKIITVLCLSVILFTACDEQKNIDILSDRAVSEQSLEISQQEAIESAYTLPEITNWTGTEKLGFEVLYTPTDFETIEMSYDKVLTDIETEIETRGYELYNISSPDGLNTAEMHCLDDQFQADIYLQGEDTPLFSIPYGGDFTRGYRLDMIPIEWENDEILIGNYGQYIANISSREVIEVAFPKVPEQYAVKPDEYFDPSFANGCRINFERNIAAYELRSLSGQVFIYLYNLNTHEWKKIYTEEKVEKYERACMYWLNDDQLIFHAYDSKDWADSNSYTDKFYLYKISTDELIDYLSNQDEIWSVRGSYSGLISIIRFSNEKTDFHSILLDLKNNNILFSYPGTGRLMYPNRYWLTQEDKEYKTVSIYDLKTFKRYVLTGFEVNTRLAYTGDPSQSNSYIFLKVDAYGLSHTFEVNFEALEQYAASS